MTLAEWTRMLRLLPLLLMSGCVGDLVELTPGSRSDLAQAPAMPDLTPPPSTGGDGGMGGAPDLTTVTPAVPFNPQIQTDIDALGCSAASCHGGTQIPILKRMPALPADITANWEQFKTASTQGENSPNLVRNLAGSGVTHTGGAVFASKQDEIYVRWLNWINGGMPQ
jgi:hypothetical protein